jgi:hypothetical protein
MLHYGDIIPCFFSFYFSPLVSLLVNMSHSNQLFIDHFIHVIDQLEVQYFFNYSMKIIVVQTQVQYFFNYSMKIIVVQIWPSWYSRSPSLRTTFGKEREALG